jgi:hypothetical protein
MGANEEHGKSVSVPHQKIRGIRKIRGSNLPLATKPNYGLQAALNPWIFIREN